MMASGVEIEWFQVYETILDQTAIERNIGKSRCVVCKRKYKSVCIVNGVMDSLQCMAVP